MKNLSVFTKASTLLVLAGIALPIFAAVTSTKMAKLTPAKKEVTKTEYMERAKKRAEKRWECKETCTIACQPFSECMSEKLAGKGRKGMRGAAKACRASRAKCMTCKKACYRKGHEASTTAAASETKPAKKRSPRRHTRKVKPALATTSSALAETTPAKLV